MFDAEDLYRTLFAQLCDAYGAALGVHDAGDPHQGIAIVGVRSGGAWIAERLAADLSARAGNMVPFGVVNVSLHRDDFASKGFHGHAGPTQLPFEITGHRILLIDDVLYTGRTIRAALNEMYDYGRPAGVELAVLVDRGGRELPVEARFKAVQTSVSDRHALVLLRDAAGRFSFDTASRSDG